MEKKMRGIGFWMLCVVFLTNIGVANVVPVSIEYTGQIDSYFRTAGVVTNLSATTINGTVQAYKPTAPFAGGMAINKPAGMSSNAIQLVTVFVRAWMPGAYPDTFPDAWASGYIEGELHIGESQYYPNGTPLELHIDYLTGNLENPARFYLNRGVAIETQDYDLIWKGTHDTYDTIETYSIPVIAGSSYLFYVWQTLGSSYQPVPIATIVRTGSGVSVDFQVIPEPTTFCLFALTSLILRKKVNFFRREKKL